ncbi:MAG: N-acetyltransferase [Bacteroidetes bacterium]|nr:N-acetyltransferase [Bacteroidota bacterium]
MNIQEAALIHNEAKHRFELHIDGVVSFIEYKPVNESLIIIEHTEVPSELEGQGVGKAMVEKMLKYVESKNWKIIPLCPFTSSYIQRHIDWDKVVYRVMR